MVHYNKLRWLDSWKNIYPPPPPPIIQSSTLILTLYNTIEHIYIQYRCATYKQQNHERSLAKKKVAAKWRFMWYLCGVTWGSTTTITTSNPQTTSAGGGYDQIQIVRPIWIVCEARRIRSRGLCVWIIAQFYSAVDAFGPAVETLLSTLISEIKVQKY